MVIDVDREMAIGRWLSGDRDRSMSIVRW